MRGSLALWYEGHDQEVTANVTGTGIHNPRGQLQPIVLHFILWRDLAVRGANFLDVGMLFMDKGSESVTREARRTTSAIQIAPQPALWRAACGDSRSLCRESSSTISWST